MRAIVREQLQAGKSPDADQRLLRVEIRRMGAAQTQDHRLQRAVLDFALCRACARRHCRALVCPALGAGRKNAEQSATPAPVSQQIRAELLRKNFEQPDLEDASAKAQLLRERARLRNELIDLDFDFQSGKLSESDYAALKQEIETKAGTVIQQLGSLPPEPAAKPAPAGKSRTRDVKSTPTHLNSAAGRSLPAELFLCSSAWR